MESMRDLAARLLGLMDLTSLNAHDDAGRIRRLCGMAVAGSHRVAAVCIWPRFVAVAREALCGTGVAVAVVANFPDGEATADTAAAQTAAAVAAGADEIDVVFPYRALLAGDELSGLALVRACRAACGPQTVLKVILETGQLASIALMRRAAELALEGGAHFLKTSTGMTAPGATIEAASVLLSVIAQAAERGMAIGLKVSGGVRTIPDAQAYLALYERHFGEGSANPRHFRIGASALITPVLAALG
jgi:deoxyribose-phosphate aldolase